MKIKTANTIVTFGEKPDAFTNTNNGRGITWGISHLTNVTTWSRNHAMLLRFDCDLSLDVNDPVMKRTGIAHKPDVYFRQGLTAGQRRRAVGHAKKLTQP